MSNFSKHSYGKNKEKRKGKNKKNEKQENPDKLVTQARAKTLNPMTIFFFFLKKSPYAEEGTLM